MDDLNEFVLQPSIVQRALKLREILAKDDIDENRASAMKNKMAAYEIEGESKLFIEAESQEDIWQQVMIDFDDWDDWLNKI